eukprot:TRINITY_DN9134_c0_g1_i1.p1 TRINITY_DN9134_c0_g1~~TRINITY_DN9134_c0_g1_i1.p1  ORF type:complete len:115 (-),score=21.56 TRINITY_DN9134_c0_g1_i1:17-361(-)
MEFEVAAALIDASRKLSSGDVATDTSAQVDADRKPRLRTGSLIPFSAAAIAMLGSGEIQPNQLDKPSDSGWLGGWRKGTRALSESEGSSSIKLDIMSWLTGGSQDKNLPNKDWT